MQKEANALLRYLAAAGHRVEHGAKHIRVYHHSDPSAILGVSTSLGRGRGWDNLLSRAKRLGFVPDDWTPRSKSPAKATTNGVPDADLDREVARARERAIAAEAQLGRGASIPEPEPVGVPSVSEVEPEKEDEMAAFKFEAITAEDAREALKPRGGPVGERGPSKGQEAVEAFLSAGQAIARIGFPRSDNGTKERQALHVSATNYLGAHPEAKLGVHKDTPNTLLFVNMESAPRSLHDQYDLQMLKNERRKAKRQGASADDSKALDKPIRDAEAKLGYLQEVVK